MKAIPMPTGVRAYVTTAGFIAAALALILGLAIPFANPIILAATSIGALVAAFALVKPESALLAFLFLAPFNVPVTIATVQTRNLYISLTDIPFVICAIAYAMRRATGSGAAEPTRWRDERQMQWLGGWMAVCAASWLAMGLFSDASYFWASLFSLLRLARFPFYFAVSRKLATDNAGKYCKVALLSGAGAVGVGMIQYARPGALDVLWGAPPEFGWGDRLYGTFTYPGPNVYGAYMAVLFCFALACCMFTRGLLVRICLLVLMAGSLVCMAGTLSRAGLLALIASLGALVFCLRRPRVRLAFLIVAFTALAAIYAAPGYRSRIETPLYGEGQAEFGGYDYSVWRRINLLEIARDEIVKSPVLGRGFRPVAAEIARQGGAETGLHDAYLDIGVKAGVSALLLFLAFLGSTVRQLWHCGVAATDPVRKSFFFGLLAGVVGLMASAVANENFTDDNLAPLIWALLGVAAYMAGTERRVPSTSRLQPTAPAPRQP